jgi:hypothetical protein
VSYQVFTWVLENSPTKGADRLVLLVLASHARQDGEGARPSYATIGREANVNRSTVRKAMRRLREEGRIERTHSETQHKPATWQVSMTGWAASPATSKEAQRVPFQNPLAVDIDIAPEGPLSGPPDPQGVLPGPPRGSSLRTPNRPPTAIQGAEGDVSNSSEKITDGNESDLDVFAPLAAAANVALDVGSTVDPESVVNDLEISEGIEWNPQAPPRPLNTSHAAPSRDATRQLSPSPVPIAVTSPECASDTYSLPVAGSGSSTTTAPAGSSTPSPSPPATATDTKRPTRCDFCGAVEGVNADQVHYSHEDGGWSCARCFFGRKSAGSPYDPRAD